MKSPFDLAGRKAVVTGGSRGIGGAIAELFLEHGAEVAICHLADEANASSLRERMAARGHALHCTECDVSSPAAVDQFAEWATQRLGQVDIVVNSAGVGGGDRPFESTDARDWDLTVGVNLRGTMLVTRAFFAGMTSRRWGRVINVASQLAYKGAPGLAHYCAAKAGVVGFTRALAYEVPRAACWSMPSRRVPWTRTCCAITASNGWHSRRASCRSAGSARWERSHRPRCCWRRKRARSTWGRPCRRTGATSCSEAPLNWPQQAVEIRRYERRLVGLIRQLKPN